MTSSDTEPENEPVIETLPESVQKSPNLPWLLIVFGFLLASLSLWIFAELAEDILESHTIAFDNAVISCIHSFKSPLLLNFMFIITETGSLVWITTFSLLTIFWLWFNKKDKLSILFFMITIAGGGLLTYILKFFFHRARPSIDNLIDASGFSFPSGHAMGSMIFYGFIGYLVIRSERNKMTKVITSIFLLLFILLIGISRIYLNVHYPSDVIAGFSAGLFWLILTISALRVLKWQRERKIQNVL